MTWWQLIAIVGAVTVLDVAIVWAIVHLGWRAWPQEFPARPLRPDAVSRRFQSLRLDIVNFGFSFTVVVDEAHLHLQPAKLMRWVGARPASIPWESITIQKRSPRWITAHIGRHTIKGPAWCLELAGDSR